MKPRPPVKRAWRPRPLQPRAPSSSPPAAATRRRRPIPPSRRAQGTVAAGGGRSDAAPPPIPLGALRLIPRSRRSSPLQQDRHTTLSGLLLRAEAAPDPLERMLAVCRWCRRRRLACGWAETCRVLVPDVKRGLTTCLPFCTRTPMHSFCLPACPCRALLYAATDVLRPGRAFGDTPTAILGHHYLSKRQLGEGWRRTVHALMFVSGRVASLGLVRYPHLMPANHLLPYLPARSCSREAPRRCHASLPAGKPASTELCSGRCMSCCHCDRLVQRPLHQLLPLPPHPATGTRCSAPPVQELCAHEPLPVTQHAKYTTAAAPSSGPGTSQPAAAPAVTLQLRLTPAAVARQQQGSLRDKLPGGSKGSKGAAADMGGIAAQPPAWVECELEVRMGLSFLPVSLSAWPGGRLVVLDLRFSCFPRDTQLSAAVTHCHLPCCCHPHLLLTGRDDRHIPAPR